MFALATSCPQLQVMDISGASHVSDDGVCAVVQSCLEITGLGLCGDGVTDVSMHAIAKHCKHLQKLDIFYLENITVNGVEEVLKNCNRLTHLYYSEDQVEDEEQFFRWRTQFPAVKLELSMETEFEF